MFHVKHKKSGFTPTLKKYIYNHSTENATDQIENGPRTYLSTW